MEKTVNNASLLPTKNLSTPRKVKSHCHTHKLYPHPNASSKPATLRGQGVRAPL
ncbi:hypothetical protein MBAV_006391 [Candidatus Magnetobacterium bavaricum]|uniref:Uncharacterized protein n=1 Tax=Candidatus Magnetobacterium bavaricum TaxID=29290 RepID=A0A0F3GHW4_9BACT|nr:hypothetical protein MBAV_006391 [Candidatus Magnetobacterium bavaricum]